ncbi:MAG: hypothetical protein FWE14_12935, partial [Lachnospiraceae bacterium]|nr:hypothetical protein [Lachnospiraceae bacterium]
MNIETAFILITFISLVINYTTMLITFPHRFGKAVTICIPIVFSIVVHIILLLTDSQVAFYRFYGVFCHFPIYMILSKGIFLQRIFVLLFVIVCTGFQAALASAISGIFTIAESNEFWLMVFILLMVMYTVYVFMIFRFIRHLLTKLFISGSQKIWVMYSLMAVFTYFTMVVAISVSEGPQRIALLL